MISRLFKSAVCGLIAFATAARAATRTYDFEIGWVTANPDNAMARPVMGINGQWPLPHITATTGDQVIVNVKNSLGNQSTSLHFHGLYQNGTTNMDGQVAVTQCPIAPGASFQYDFMVSWTAMELSLVKSKTDQTDQTTRHILVPLSHARAVSRRSSWSLDCQRSRWAVQGQVRRRDCTYAVGLVSRSNARSSGTLRQLRQSYRRGAGAERRADERYPESQHSGSARKDVHVPHY